MVLTPSPLGLWVNYWGLFVSEDIASQLLPALASLQAFRITSNKLLAWKRICEACNFHLSIFCKNKPFKIRQN